MRVEAEFAFPRVFNIFGAAEAVAFALVNTQSDRASVVTLADSPTHEPAIVEVSGGSSRVMRSSSQERLPEELISQAQAVSWTSSDGETVYGFYYAPKNPQFTAPEGDLPPLLVNVHGGPTSSARAGLSIGVQYWTSRGFAYLDVNYRGSTGFGRTYRERLNGHWGVLDVQDCAEGAQYLVSQGLADPARLAIRGRSSGGYTVLSALADTDVFTAGTSLFGIADLNYWKLQPTSLNPTTISSCSARTI